MRAICRTTGAKIECDREGEGALSLTRLITLSGTRKEVQAAKVRALPLMPGWASLSPNLAPWERGGGWDLKQQISVGRCGLWDR